MSGPPRAEPVTVMVARRVIPGREHEFQQWTQELSGTIATYPGCLGTGLLRPSHLGDPWHLIFRFDTVEHLTHWESSAERADRITAAAHLVESTHIHRVTGLETWFAPPRPTLTAPPRWKMFLVSGTVFYLLNVALSVVYGRYVVSWPIPVRVLFSSYPVTALATWAVMPWVAQRLRGWLFESRDAASDA